jgi:hypothetical protein
MIDATLVLLGILFSTAFLAACYETFRLLSVDGKIRRGFCFRRVPLSETEQRFLQALKRDTTKIDERYWRFENVVWAHRSDFILRKGNELCIRFSRRGYGTGFPFIGYVNLDQESPNLQIRGSLLMHLLFPSWLILIVVIEPATTGLMLALMLGVVILLVINHWIVATGIQRQLHRLAGVSQV